MIEHELLMHTVNTESTIVHDLESLLPSHPIGVFL